MKALISPNQPAYSYDKTLLGQRIAQVSDIEFDVAAPLFWTDCPENCYPDGWYYANGECLPKPEEPAPPES